MNGTTPGAEVKSDPQYFVRPLPTPKLEIRLKKQNSSGQAYDQYLVLTNASDYKADAGNWQVTAYLMNQPNTEITLNASNTEAQIANGLGSATRLRATATPGTDATGAWMESARYDEEIGIPRTYYKDNDQNRNSGLVHGTAVINKAGHNRQHGGRSVDYREPAIYRRYDPQHRAELPRYAGGSIQR